MGKFFGSIKQRVLFLFISIVLIITMSILTIDGLLSRSLVKNLLEQNATAVVQTYARGLQSWRSNRMREVEKLAQTQSLKGSNWDQIEEFLLRQSEELGAEQHGLFLAERDGESMLTGDYFSRVFLGETIISKPILTADSGEKIIVAAAPVWDESGHRVLRLLGLPIGLSEIYETLAEIKLEYPDWEIYLLDEEGQFITHNNPDFIMQRSIREFYGDWDNFSQQETGSFQYDLEGTSFHAFFNRVADAEGWTIVIRLPAASFSRPYQRLISYSLIASAIGLILVIKLGFWFASTITKPIVELKEIFRRGAEGDLTVRAEVASTDEFGDTRVFFNRMMETIGTMTYLDPLTNLPNRQYFLSHLANCLSENSTVILALVGIRGLSELKTVLSPEVTDEILLEVADLLSTVKDGKIVIGRVADAEFGLFAPSNTGGILQMIDRLNDLFSHTLRLEKRDLSVRLYGGVTISEGEAVSAKAFFQQAQTALYDAEHYAGESTKLYNPNMHRTIVDRVRFQTEIRNALERRQFTAFYQPIIELDSGAVVGKEALIRWKHPVRGLLAPSNFLKTAEQGGFIEQIGEYMLDEVCKQHQEWQKQGRSTGWVAVNISASHFRSPGFPQLVQSVLEKHRVPPACLRIELTEDTMLSPTPAVLNNLQELRSLGVNLAIDDFGTAYSTLEYLVRYPMDIIKIDKTFISHLDHDQRTRGLVRSIIGMGKNLSMAIVAEGVERLRQLNLLRDMGCTEAQGYFFSRPVPQTDYLELASSLKKRQNAGFLPQIE